MGLRGPPPKPKATHEAQGTRLRESSAARRAGGVDFEPVNVLPDPPAYLGTDGREMWTRFGAQLIKAGLLQEPDMWMFRLLCGLYDRNQTAMRENREILAGDNATIQRLLSEFGASPSSRRRIAPNGDKAKENSFGKFKPTLVA